MISPELLRRYPFYGVLNDDQLKKLAMIANETSIPAGTQLFEEHQAADTFYLLVEGNVDLSYKSEEEFHPKAKKVFDVGQINPGEIFGISALVEPYEYNASAVASINSRVLVMNADKLRALLEEDSDLGCAIMHQLAKALKERLNYTRVQLAAAWA